MVNTSRRMSLNPFEKGFDEGIYSNESYIVDVVIDSDCTTIHEKLRYGDELYMTMFPDSYPWGDRRWRGYAEAMACAFFDYYVDERELFLPESIGSLYEEDSPILQDAIDTIRMSEIVDFMALVDSESGNVVPSETYADAMRLALKIAFSNEVTSIAYFCDSGDVMTCYFPKFDRGVYESIARDSGIEFGVAEFKDAMGRFVCESNESTIIWQNHVLASRFDDELHINPIDKSLDYYETFRAVLECMLSQAAGMVVFYKPDYADAVVGKVLMFHNGRYCHVGESIIKAMAEYLSSGRKQNGISIQTTRNDTIDDYDVVNSISAYCNMMLTIMSVNEREIMPDNDRKVFLYEPSLFLKTSVEGIDEDEMSVEYDADKLFTESSIDEVFDYIYDKVDLMPTPVAISIANLSAFYNSVLNTFLGEPIEPIIDEIVAFGNVFERKTKESLQQSSENFGLPMGIIERICSSYDVNGKIDLLEDIYNSMDSSSKSAVDSVVDKIEKNLDRTVTVTVAYDSNEQKIKDLFGGRRDDEGRRLEVITIEFYSHDMKFNIKDRKRIRSIITKSLIEKGSYVVVTYSPEKKGSVVFLSCVQWDGTNCNDQGLDASLELLSSLRVQIPLNSEYEGDLRFDYIELGNYGEE